MEENVSEISVVMQIEIWGKGMELKDLRYFVEISDQKSIRKAAASLYVSQPNLTRAMQNLEHEIGAELLERSNKGVVLTNIGESLYCYAQSILQQVDEIGKLTTQMQQTVQSKVGIAVAGIIMRDDLMFQCYEQILAKRTTISIYETSVEKVLEHVEKLEADIGVVSVNDIQYPILRKVAELKEIEVHEVGEGPLYVHVGKKNPFYGKKKIEVEELLEFSNIRLPADYFSNLNYMLSLDGKVRLMDFRKIITLNNYHAIISMVKRTDAFIFGNRWQAKELEHGQICSIELENCNITRKLVWMKRKREILSTKAEEFLKLIITSLEKEVGDNL